MGSVGDAYDNAMCESFFATLVPGRTGRTRSMWIGRTHDLVGLSGDTAR